MICPYCSKAKPQLKCWPYCSYRCEDDMFILWPTRYYQILKSVKDCERSKKES